MSEIFFIVKCVFYAALFIFFAFFATYFILANDHTVTVYINPIYFSADFYGTSPEFVLPVWKLGFIAFLVGFLVMGMIFRMSIVKQKAISESLSKENSNLKSKFDKVKTDISKCVS